MLISTLKFKGRSNLKQDIDNPGRVFSDLFSTKSIFQSSKFCVVDFKSMDQSRSKDSIQTKQTKSRSQSATQMSKAKLEVPLFHGKYFWPWT